MAELGLNLGPLPCPRGDLAGGVQVGAGTEVWVWQSRTESPEARVSHWPEKSSCGSPPRGPHKNAVRGQAGHRKVWHGLMSTIGSPGLWTTRNHRPQQSF